jgi:Fe-Mn family superoxide dismutase
MTRYTLPDLAYDYGSLEPHIAGKIMELHHDKHHRAYVDGANRALEQILQSRKEENFDQIATLERALAFNVSGHVLHSLFWQNLSPEGGGRPAGPLANAIERDFRSFDLFKRQVIKVASTIMGSGWALLIYEPSTQRLGTTQVHDHQSEITQGSIPLLAVDAWEHAYYLQYHADKERYFEALWNLWNWEDVAERFHVARNLDLRLKQAARGQPSDAEASLPH